MRIAKNDIPIKLDVPGAKARQLPDFGTADGVLSAEYFSLGAGTDIAPLLEGLEHDLCQAPHWGYVLEGEIVVTYGDGAKPATAVTCTTGRPATPSCRRGCGVGDVQPAGRARPRHRAPRGEDRRSRLTPSGPDLKAETAHRARNPGESRPVRSLDVSYSLRLDGRRATAPDSTGRAFLTDLETERHPAHVVRRLRGMPSKRQCTPR